MIENGDIRIADEYIKCAKKDLKSSKILRLFSINSLSIYHLSQAIENVERAYSNMSGLSLEDIRKSGHDQGKLEKRLKSKQKEPIIDKDGLNLISINQSRLLLDAYLYSYHVMKPDIRRLFKLEDTGLAKDQVVELRDLDKEKIARTSVQVLGEVLDLPEKKYPEVVRTILNFLGINPHKHILNFRDEDYNSRPADLLFRLNIQSGELNGDPFYFLLNLGWVKVFNELIVLSYIANANTNFCRYPYSDERLWPSKYDIKEAAITKLYWRLYKCTTIQIDQCSNLINDLKKFYYNSST